MLVKNLNLHVVLTQRVLPLLLDTLRVLLVLFARVESYLHRINEVVFVITRLSHSL